MNMEALKDFLWVIVALVRGKVLGQKAYRPQRFQGSKYILLFSAMPGATVSRMVKLMRSWGFRPATVEHLMKRKPTDAEHDRALLVPFLNWTNDGLSIDWPNSWLKSNWGSPERYLSMRK